MGGLGFDAQSFIDAYTMHECETCGGEGWISDEGYRYGSQRPTEVICPACDGSGYEDGDD